MSRTQRMLLVLGVGVLAFFFPGWLDDVAVALWGLSEIIGAIKNSQEKKD